MICDITISLRKNLKDLTAKVRRQYCHIDFPSSQPTKDWTQNRARRFKQIGTLGPIVQFSESDNLFPNAQYLIFIDNICKDVDLLNHQPILYYYYSNTGSPPISSPKRKPPSSQLKHRWYGPWSSFLEVIICMVCASNIRISSHYCQHELWQDLPRLWSFDTVHSFQCRSTPLFSCLLLRCWTWTMSWLRLWRILFWNGIKKSRSGQVMDHNLVHH